MALLRRLMMRKSRRPSMGCPWRIGSGAEEILIYESYEVIPKSRSLLLTPLLVALCGVGFVVFQGWKFASLEL